MATAYVVETRSCGGEDEDPQWSRVHAVGASEKEAMSFLPDDDRLMAWPTCSCSSTTPEQGAWRCDSDTCEACNLNDDLYYNQVIVWVITRFDGSASTEVSRFYVNDVNCA